MLTDAMHVRQTEAFIAEHPVDIVVKRTSKIRDGKGGFKKDTVRTLPAQTVRKVGSTRVGDTRSITTAEGRIVVPTATVIAMPEGDLLAGDKFDVSGVTFEVLKIDRDPPWRLQAAIMEEQ